SEDSGDFTAALFFRRDSSDWFASAEGFFGRASVDTERRPLPGVVAESEYSLKWFGAALSAGKLFELGGVRITPRLGLGYVRLEFLGLTETGAPGWNQVILPARNNSLEIRAGVHFTREIDLGGKIFSPRLDLGFGYETRDTTMIMMARFADQEVIAPFVNETPDPGRARALVELGGTLSLTDRVDLYFDYKGVFRRSDRIHGVTVGASFSF
ncbi:MAG: autotransporter outer membrane beta-barrel domain-containing protein, partial [Deltaproteobacteria bacterium]|nr:autotransporter outer membrane beta-barrel domain-containing protein [Deltaproteobacteria bacterium]